MVQISLADLGLRAFDANGFTVSGALCYVYDAGTTTPVTTYSDSGLTTPQAFPVPANANGAFPEIYVEDGIYKVDITDDSSASLPGFPRDNLYLGTAPEVARSYATRDAAVTAIAGGVLDRISEGTVFLAGGFRYVKMLSSNPTYGTDPIPDMPGCAPNGPVYAEHFGAVADGATDAAAKINLAIDYVAAIGGGIVNLSEGTYLCEEFVAYADNVSIIGRGKYSTVLKRKAGDLIHVMNNNEQPEMVRIAHLTVDGNNSVDLDDATGMHGIRSNGAINFTLDNVLIKDCHNYGLGMQGIENIEDNVRLIDCDFIGNGLDEGSGVRADGVDIKSVFDLFARGCRFEGNGKSGLDARSKRAYVSDCHATGNGWFGFNLRGRGDLATDVPGRSVITNCISWANQDGIGYQHTSAVLPGDITISNCVIHSNTNDGIDLQAGVNASISNCQIFSNSNMGVWAVNDAGDLTSSVTISGGRIENNGNHGVRIQSGTSTCLMNVTGVQLTNNTGAGIRNEQNDGVVTGCIIYDNGGWAYDTGGASLRYTAVGNAHRNNTAGEFRGSAFAGAVVTNNNNN